MVDHYCYACEYSRPFESFEAALDAVPDSVPYCLKCGRACVIRQFVQEKPVAWRETAVTRRK